MCVKKYDVLFQRKQSVHSLPVWVFFSTRITGWQNLSSSSSNVSTSGNHRMQISVTQNLISEIHNQSASYADSQLTFCASVLFPRRWAETRGPPHFYGESCEATEDIWTGIIISWQIDLCSVSATAEKTPHWQTDWNCRIWDGECVIWNFQHQQDLCCGPYGMWRESSAKPKVIWSQLGLSRHSACVLWLSLLWQSMPFHPRDSLLKPCKTNRVGKLVLLVGRRKALSVHGSRKLCDSFRWTYFVICLGNFLSTTVTHISVICH